MLRLTALTSLLILASCASPPARTVAGGDHPANPAAGSNPEVPSTQPGRHDHAGHGQRAAVAAQAVLYQCPMHPKVTSTNPEERCPECGMKINRPVKNGGRP
ncbi:MAG TPA: heavy metal-binding domain-containing protein [Phycisphaerales bacterium]|nr:heavy metal-binding domain-containing protein [Phycisphaerales bacterium]